MGNHQTSNNRGGLQRFARPGSLSAAIALILSAGALQAQEGIDFEEIIVTGTTGGASKFDTSLSVTTVSAERAENFVPVGTVDILRSIPGIRAEATGGDSNGNITVRGVPLGGGGSKFLQIHEDGLPVLQFGDIIVGNADNYFTYDQTVARVEAIKGGTAATLASNSPSGVINFISKTGEEEGGSFSYTTGLDYDTNRIDFAYGTPVGNDWAFHVGGFYREGEGIRETGFDSNSGGQIKLSVTRNFDNGYGRIYVKSLNDQTATILPMVATLGNDGIAGFDPRYASNIPAELINQQTTDGAGGTRESSIRDGNLVTSNVIGGEFVFEISDTLTLTERFRSAANSGKFFGAFSAGIGDATDPSTVLPAGFLATVAAPGLGYASGLNGGTALTPAQLASLNGNGLIQDIRTFDNDINSLDNFTNDMSLTKSFDTVDLTVGYYTASQDLDIDWFWQSHIADVQDQPRLLDLYDGATRLTSMGQIAYGAPQWGGCCTRDTAIETTVDAYYVAFNWDPSEDLSLNASIRQDSGSAIGSWVAGSVSAIDVDNDGTISFAENHVETIGDDERANPNTGHFAYDWDYTSFALGANYVLSDTMAVFANYSDGGRAGFGDRLADGGYIVQGQVQPGAVENTVQMLEAGIKYDGENWAIFATAFNVKTDDVNSESARGLNVPARVREFETNGFEIEATANLGDFSIFGGFTYTDAEIVGSNDPSVVGNTPRRQPKILYSSTFTYHMDQHNMGISLIGRDDSYVGDDNSNTLDGYMAINAFANYALSENLSARLAINNLTNEIGLTEAEGGFQTVNGMDLIRARSITGRSTTLELKYEF